MDHGKRKSKEKSIVHGSSKKRSMDHGAQTIVNSFMVLGFWFKSISGSRLGRQIMFSASNEAVERLLVQPLRIAEGNHVERLLPQPLRSLWFWVQRKKGIKEYRSLIESGMTERRGRIASDFVFGFGNNLRCRQMINKKPSVRRAFLF